MICSDIWHKYHSWYFKITNNNFNSRYHSWYLCQISLQIILLPILIMLKKVAYCYFTTRVCGIMFKFPGGFKRKIGWQKWQRTTLQNVNAINNWKHTKHCLPILFYISSTEVKYKLYRYILKRVKIKPRNVFTKTVNFSCYFKLFSISVKHLFRCQRNQSCCKIVLLSATQGVSIILWGPV